ETGPRRPVPRPQGSVTELQRGGGERMATKVDLAVLAPEPSWDVEAARRPGSARRSDLSQARSQWEYLFSRNPIPMWIFDRETLAFLEVNRAAIRHYGYDADEFRRMTIADIRPGEDKAALFDLMRHLQAPDPRPVGTWRHRRKDGSIIDVE